eukprot:11617305-Karenia_brevis.AAC.1
MARQPALAVEQPAFCWWSNPRGCAAFSGWPALLWLPRPQQHSAFGCDARLWLGSLYLLWGSLLLVLVLVRDGRMK